MTGALPAAPHGKAFYATMAVLGFLGGSIFFLGSLLPTHGPFALRLVRAAISLIFYAGGFQSIERLWRPEVARRRSGMLSETAHRNLHTASMAALGIAGACLAAAAGLRWFGNAWQQDAGHDAQFLSAVFVCLALCLADWNGEKLWAS